MNSSRHFLITLWSVLLSLGLAVAEDNVGDQDELGSLRESYLSAVEKATFPIEVRYRKDLEDLKIELTKAGRLAEAREVDARLKQLAEKSAKPAGEITSEKLKVLEERHQRTREGATRPLTQTYIRHLVKLKAKYQSSGNLQKTLEAEKEIKRLEREEEERLTATAEKLTERMLIGTRWIYPYVSRSKGKGEMLLEFEKEGKTNVLFRKEGEDWGPHMSTHWSLSGDWKVTTFVSRLELTVSRNLREITWRASGRNYRAVRYEDN